MLLFYTHPKAMRKSPPLYWYTLFTAGIFVHILYQLSITKDGQYSKSFWKKDSAGEKIYENSFKNA